MQKRSTNWGILYMDLLQPVLYWLHRRVPARWAPSYFRALHELVYQWPIQNASPYSDLVSGTEWLLRIFCAYKAYVSCEPDGYCKDKFCTAVGIYERYFEKVGRPLLPNNLDASELVKMPSHDLLERCCQHFQQWSDCMANQHDEHAEWVRFVNALFHHLSELEAADQFLDVAEPVQEPVCRLLSALLGRGFSFSLPKKEEEYDLEELHSLCEHAWEETYLKRN